MPAFDARELFAALARHGVEYVTVGGIAMQAHGAQRLTQDLDIAIASSRENLDRLAAALEDVDARILGPDGRRSRSVPTAALLGAGDQWHLLTDHGPLDVVTLPAHLGPFSEMRARALDTTLGDLTVPIAHRDDLLRMKRAAGRPQDLADVELLESLGDGG
ncbi:MAG: nucleotidyl transferase AbiEii/AbiGii toxin family protein [Solirubrobacterales bacterium]|nr:nucleotidyl transferase AbiEii/AbiGii toxin family protein [Solirubrobacterales bacterium]